MAGSEGKIYYTSNAGADWLRALVDSALITAFPVEKIQFYNSLSGYAVGGAFDIAGMVWKTSNGGRNWKTEIVGAEPLNDIHIFNSSEAICVGGDFEYGASRLTTSNSGTNWNYVEFGYFGICRSIDYRIPGEGWISLGIVDSFIVTTNNGATWLLRGTPDGSQIFDLVFTDSVHGWAVGYNGTILKYSSTIVNIPETNNQIPESVILYQNYPNPFNPETRIRYELPRSVNNQDGFYVKLSVYDILGNEISELVNGRQTEGKYEVKFNASDLPSGVYFVKLFTQNMYLTDINSSLTQKILLLK
ncbi:MAG: T9SS type A sorting domain-containing protein [Bacteroidetes bacterium]|nr:T9SS type A sorting domain-containing protein [Bacteroidota bacterium]